LYVRTCAASMDEGRANRAAIFSCAAFIVSFSVLNFFLNRKNLLQICNFFVKINWHMGNGSCGCKK
ncbi:MAG: hypothetical protein LUI87_06115, partial [Lachnospiraceae bacterium]|nr:hypothetical protein [Lachnospiraceae bacterium]